MDDRLKFRVTGLVLVVALAAIVLPMAFDGAGVADLPQPAAVPAAPAAPLAAMDTDGSDWAFVQERQALAEGDFGGVDSADLGQPVLTLDNPPAGAAAAAPGPASPTSDVRLDADGVPEAFAVQLASFADDDNARGLRDRLQEAGYAAFLTTSAANGEALTRVAVGPSISRIEAEQLREELRDAYGLDGLVVRFGL